VFLLKDQDSSQPNHLKTMTNISPKHMRTAELLCVHAYIRWEKTVNPQPA